MIVPHYHISVTIFIFFSLISAIFDLLLVTIYPLTSDNVTLPNTISSFATFMSQCFCFSYLGSHLRAIPNINYCVLHCINDIYHCQSQLRKCYATVMEMSCKCFTNISGHGMRLSTYEHVTLTISCNKNYWAALFVLISEAAASSPVRQPL